MGFIEVYIIIYIIYNIKEILSLVHEKIFIKIITKRVHGLSHSPEKRILQKFKNC